MDWERTIGFGVAGNFAGHLEQAGEASDFVNVAVEDAAAPKGLFPFFVPGGGEHFLHCQPVSSARLRLGSLDEKHQIEPEVALLCDLEYQDGAVVAVHPRRAFAHNDCSIRREGARKISEKKNWGEETKGTAAEGVDIDRFSAGGVLDRYRLACFLVREGRAHAYGQDSEVRSYSYFHEQLLDWIARKLREQRDGGPLEDLAGWLDKAGHPPQALISIGATRYTDYGETTFLAPGDESVVILYDADRYEAAAVQAIAEGKGAEKGPGLSVLRQQVVTG